MNRIDVLVEIESSVKDVLGVTFLGALLFAELAIPSPFDCNETFPVDFLENSEIFEKMLHKSREQLYRRFVLRWEKFSASFMSLVSIFDSCV
jgi:hypothetical protein